MRKGWSNGKDSKSTGLVDRPAITVQQHFALFKDTNGGMSVPKEIHISIKIRNVCFVSAHFLVKEGQFVVIN